MEIGNLPQKWFWVVIVKIIKEVGRRMDAEREMLEVFSKELENIRRNTELEISIVKILKYTWGNQQQIR